MIRAIPRLEGGRDGSHPVENPPRPTDTPPVEGKIRLSGLPRTDVIEAGIEKQRFTLAWRELSREFGY